MNNSLDALLEKEREVIDFLKFEIDNLYDLAEQLYPRSSKIKYEYRNQLKEGLVREIFIDLDGSVKIIVGEDCGEEYPEVYSINLSCNPRVVEE